MENWDHSNKGTVVYIPVVCRVCITKLNVYNIQYFFTCNNFVNKRATPDEPDKNAANVYFP